MITPHPDMVPDGRSTVLIVDDDAFSSRILKTLLEKTGRYSVSLETDGSKAMEVATRMHPDMIFLDIVMPGVEGTTLAYRMRADPALKETPIVFLTGIVPKETSNPHRMLGEFPFIPKPIDVDEVIRCLEANLKN